MKDISKLEKRFLDFDEIEEKGGVVEVAQPTEEHSQLTIVTSSVKSSSAINESANDKSPEKMTKSSSSSLDIKLEDGDISDEYIEDKIERMLKWSESLNKQNQKKSLEKTGESPAASDYPIIGKTGGGRDYTLAADYTYHTKADYSITAHKGFVTDLSSIPRILWVILPPDSLSLTAPIIHDLLYRHGGVLPIDQVNAYREITRDESDLLFLEIMKSEGISSWRCKAGYLAVSKFGKFVWKGKKK
jgi:hypothetical protein